MSGKQASELASQGGIARALSMTGEQRSEIARKAAEERWARERGIPKATHEGVLSIGDILLSCAVLEDGTRVFSERRMATALGWVRSGTQFAKKRAEGDGANLPVFLMSKHVFPFISNELAMELSNPHPYRSRKGGKPAHGIDAKLLPDICDTWLRARAAGTLPASLQHVATKAEILVRGLAKVGVVALVDEATGYQAERTRDELQRLLEAYVVEEMRPWVRRFPNEFFEQVYRLQGWKYEPGVRGGPRYVGKLINKYVYKRLPPGVLEELQRKNPTVEGHRKHKHHQLLTEDIGDPHLDRVITSVTTLMRASRDKVMFDELVARALPVPGEQVPLLLSFGDDP